MLSAIHISKSFGVETVLDAVTFHLNAGERLGLVGPNGCGKTTLLRILAGLSNPSKGEVLLEGRSARDEQARRRRGVLGHGIGVYDELSARENLLLFARLYGVKRPRETAAQWLERTGLASVAEAPAREFSRGMRQRLALARVFLHEPSLLLLDEPFTSLDDRAIALLQELLREALGRGATVVMSTHQLREALELATHAALLVRGRLSYSGARTPEMAADPGWLYRHYGEAA